MGLLGAEHAEFDLRIKCVMRRNSYYYLFVIAL